MSKWYQGWRARRILAEIKDKDNSASKLKIYLFTLFTRFLLDNSYLKSLPSNFR